MPSSVPVLHRCLLLLKTAWYVQPCVGYLQTAVPRPLYRQAHQSAGMQVDANLALVGFNAERDFDAIVSADLFERLKPAPDIFLAAAEQVRPMSLNSDMQAGGSVMQARN